MLQQLFGSVFRRSDYPICSKANSDVIRAEYEQYRQQLLGDPLTNILKPASFDLSMPENTAKYLYGNSDPRHAFSTEDRTVARNLKTSLGKKFEFDKDELIFDTSIPRSQCVIAQAAIKIWWTPIKSVEDQRGKYTRAYVLCIPYANSKRVFVAVPDYFHTAGGQVRDPESVAQSDVFTHLYNNPYKEKRYAHISAINGHTGQELLDSVMMTERSIKCPWFKNSQFLENQLDTQ